MKQEQQPSTNNQKPNQANQNTQRVGSMQIQRQKSLQINILQWEKSIQLNSQEQSLLQQLENMDKKIDPNLILTKQKKQQHNLAQKSDFNIQEQWQNQTNSQDEKLFNEDFIQTISEKNQQQKQEQQNKHIFQQIKEIKVQNSKFLTFLNDILGNLEDINHKFEDLQNNKAHLIDKISEFYDKSQNIIDQEKSLLTLQQLLKENVQYYLQAEDIERELSDMSFDITQRQVFENLLQRFLSEINDGIIFFESNENFKNSHQYYDQYVKLKAKILALIKSFLFKIFNKEFAFINEKINGISQQQLQTIFLDSYTHFVQFTDPQNQHIQVMNHVNYERCLFLCIVFPQFQHIFSDNHQKKLYDLQIVDSSSSQFQLNQTLKNLISYIENTSFKDLEISQIYQDVFLNYLTYCRANLHKEIQDQLNQLYQHYLQQQIKQNSQFTNKQVHFIDNFMHFIFEIMVCEFYYTDYLFNYSNQITIDTLKQHWIKILDSYYDFIRPIIIKQYGIDNIFQTLDTIKNYNLYFSTTFTKCHQQDPYYKKIKNVKINNETFKILEQMFNRFSERLKQDCMHKLIQQAQIYIQEHIQNFNVNNYLKNKQLVIKQFESAENTQQKEFYPVIQNAVETLKMLSTRIEKSIFQQMACEIVSSSIQQLYQVAEKFQEKFDVFLFLAKNLIMISETIFTLNMDFLVNQQEFDFSDTKLLFNDIIQGNLPYNFNLADLVQADKLWDYASSFFNFLYRGMPKVNDLTIDIKKDIVYQVKNVFSNMNKDMTFIISKNLIDFIRKYQQLQEILNQNSKKKEDILSHQIQKDQEDLENDQQQDNQIKELTSEDKKAISELKKEELKVEEDIKLLLNQEIVKKTYIIFIENLKEMSNIMVKKLKNYMEKQLYEQLIHHIYEIQQNSLSLLSQFYIIVSKQYPEDQYDKFEFVPQQQLRQELSDQLDIKQIYNKQTNNSNQNNSNSTDQQIIQEQQTTIEQ